MQRLLKRKKNLKHFWPCKHFFRC